MVLAYPAGGATMALVVVGLCTLRFPLPTNAVVFVRDS